MLTCVDPRHLPEAFLGQAFDAALLPNLPVVDACGERGEFHTFCWGGPMFSADVPVALGERVSRDGFCFLDLMEMTNDQ